jgi:hypothetical protein
MQLLAMCGLTGKRDCRARQNLLCGYFVAVRIAKYEFADGRRVDRSSFVGGMAKVWRWQGWARQHRVDVDT